MIKKEINLDKIKIKRFFVKFFSFGKKTWFFTIVFFVTVFSFSVWTWWQCILHPSPSEQVIFDLQKERSDFEMKGKKIDSVIEKIQERKNLFEGAVDHQLDRKIFKSKEEIFQEMNPTSKSDSDSSVNSLP